MSWCLPKKNEKVIIKYNYDGFYNTELDEYLKSKNINAIYGTGLMTNCCVLQIYKMIS